MEDFGCAPEGMGCSLCELAPCDIYASMTSLDSVEAFSANGGVVDAAPTAGSVL